MSTRSEPAPKRRTRDPEARRREILEAAAEIVVEQGPAALTHRMVAERAGVALGSTTRYFASIDDLREGALRRLGDEIDSSVDAIEKELAACSDPAARLADLMCEFLADARQVHASVALVTVATSDASLRSLALRWSDRLTDILAQHVGAERAAAVDVYLNGATMHAALNDRPLDHETITRVLRALFALPGNASE